MSGIRRMVGISAVAVVLAVPGGVVAALPASAGGSAGTSLVGTYNVAVQINPAYGGRGYSASSR